jgi:hypothetical protein
MEQRIKFRKLFTTRIKKNYGLEAKTNKYFSGLVHLVKIFL